MTVTFRHLRGTVKFLHNVYCSRQLFATNFVVSAILQGMLHSFVGPVHRGSHGCSRQHRYDNYPIPNQILRGIIYWTL